MSVGLEIDGKVARITIDPPERLNAIDATAERELESIWQALETRDDISCAVLTGAGAVINRARKLVSATISFSLFACAAASTKLCSMAKKVSSISLIRSLSR